MSLLLASTVHAEVTTTHPCIADTFVQKNKDMDNFGTDSTLTMRNNTSGFARVPYIKFNVSGLQGNITNVNLKLYSDDSSAFIKAYAMDNSWDELTVTWSNKPPSLTTQIGSGTAVAASWFAIDITGYVTGDGTYSILLDEQDNSVSRLASKEGTGAAYLEITTDYVNLPPVFNTDPITDSAQLYIEYEGSIAGTASDPEGSPLRYSKVSGPEWLKVRVNGDIVGTPDVLGLNTFTVMVEDDQGGSDTATLEITVSSVTPSIIVTDRAGSNVTAQTLIDSDHIRIDAIASVSLSQGSFTYKLLEQTSEPSTAQWSAASAQDFWHDLWLYRRPTNQWVKIDVTDIDSSTVSAVYGLQSGTLTAPPDDPFTNLEYVDAMGPGMIVEADSDKTEVVPELSTIEIKKAGFNHVRMHIGRFLRDKVTPNTPSNNPSYYQLIDRWVEQIARHGMHCHIGNKGNSQWELANPDDDSPAWKDGYAAEHYDWWTNVASHFATASHRLAYHIFLETGGNSFLGDATALDAFHDDVTWYVRTIDQGRMLIYPPPSLNNVFRLVEMTFPYEDHDGGDGIDTSSGDYWFADFHRNFASGAGWVLEADKQVAENNFNEASAWIASNNVPLIVSALRPTDSNSRHDEYISNRIRFVEDLYDLADSAPIPIRITWLTYDNYNFEGGLGWMPGKLALLEAMNRQALVYDTDHDGDQITTGAETNIYGSNPYLADTDQDGILDTYECTMSIFDPLDPSDGDPMDDLGTMADFDGDGMDNAWEMLHTVEWGDNPLTASRHFDPTNPADALDDEEGDNVPNIWERILRINPNDDSSWKKDPDDTSDWDGDGSNTLVEIAAQTWPMEDSDLDFDSDYDTVGGDVDTMPYIHDEGHIVGYTYASGFNDISSQGSANNGIPAGGATVYSGVADFDGVDDFVFVPTADFGSVSNRSVSLHFRAEQDSGYQVLYKEGGADSGLSIYLDDDQLWMGVWDQPQETFVQLGGVSVQQWYSITVTFKSGNLAGYMFNGNTRMVATNMATTVATVGDAAYRTALGGSDDATLVWSGSSSTNVSGAYLMGQLDDSHIYDRVLGEGEASLLSRNDIYPARQPDLAATLPYFYNDPVVEVDAYVGEAYSSTLADDATDPNADPLTFSKIDGPAWLNVATNGALSGTPAVSNAGLNSFTVQVDDGVDGSDTATLEIDVFNLSAPVSFTVAEDAYVKENDLLFNGGANTLLVLKAESAGASKVSYLKFNVSGLTQPVGLAVLKLYSDNLATPLKAYEMDNVWAEMSVTWGNKPPLLTTEIGEGGTSVTNQWFEIDVTDYITSNGTFSITLDEQNGSVGKISSREGTHPPYLEIRTESGGNQPPTFTSDPISKSNALEVVSYSESIAGDASDPESDPLTFSKVSGPTWLNVATNGTLSGTPALGDAGSNSFTVRVEDPLALFDEAMLTIIVETNTIARYDAWSSDYGLSGTNALYEADPDEDELENLYEYALGGNPTNEVDAVWPDAEVVLDAILYTYRRRTDAAMRGLSYNLELTEDLINGVWTNDGYTVVDTAPAEAGFETVTNQISTAVKDSQFIHLNVEIE